MIKNYHCGDLLSPALQGMLEKKLAKLDKFGEDMTNDVYMTMEGKNYSLKMILKAKKNTFIAKEVSGDMYKNIDICVDKLNDQLVEKKIDRTGKNTPMFEDK